MKEWFSTSALEPINGKKSPVDAKKIRITQIINSEFICEGILKIALPPS